ncbi:MAG: hypothetical protein PUG96_00015 [Prevotellaceae bacterium]|nr:hypothetical protein [Prevotellaceae bacterium]
MKTKKTFLPLALAAVCLLLVACSTTKNQPEMAQVLPAVIFAFNAQGECYATNPQKISAKEFAQLAKDGGLRWVSTHRVLGNGKLEEDDYYHRIRGKSPLSYYFEGGKCYSYFFNNATGRITSNPYSFKYDEADNSLTINDFLMFKIVRMNDEEVSVIGPFGTDENGQCIYAYTVYRRMDAKGVAEMKAKLTLDPPLIKVDQSD